MQHKNTYNSEEEEQEEEEEQQYFTSNSSISNEYIVKTSPQKQTIQVLDDQSSGYESSDEEFQSDKEVNNSDALGKDNLQYQQLKKKSYQYVKPQKSFQSEKIYKPKRVSRDLMRTSLDNIIILNQDENGKLNPQPKQLKQASIKKYQQQDLQTNSCSKDRQYQKYQQQFDIKDSNFDIINFFTLNQQKLQQEFEVFFNENLVEIDSQKQQSLSTKLFNQLQDSFKQDSQQVQNQMDQNIVQVRNPNFRRGQQQQNIVNNQKEILNNIETITEKLLKGASFEFQQQQQQKQSYQSKKMQKVQQKQKLDIQKKQIKKKKESLKNSSQAFQLLFSQEDSPDHTKFNKTADQNDYQQLKKPNENNIKKGSLDSQKKGFSEVEKALFISDYMFPETKNTNL